MRVRITHCRDNRKRYTIRPYLLVSRSPWVGPVRPAGRRGGPGAPAADRRAGHGDPAVDGEAFPAGSR
ncbi:hypothetical protein GCM10010273_00400 [Streptomyces lavendulocolor]